MSHAPSSNDRHMPWLDYPDPPLEQGSVRLREWRIDDLPRIEEASRDPEITQDTSVPTEYTTEEGRAFIERHRGRNTNRGVLSSAIADRSTDTARGLIILMKRSKHGVGGLGYLGGRVIQATRPSEERHRVARSMGVTQHLPRANRSQSSDRQHGIDARSGAGRLPVRGRAPLPPGRGWPRHRHAQLLACQCRYRRLKCDARCQCAWHISARVAA